MHREVDHINQRSNYANITSIKMATNAAKMGLKATIFIFGLKNTVFTCKNTTIAINILRNTASIRH